MANDSKSSGSKDSGKDSGKGGKESGATNMKEWIKAADSAKYSNLGR